MLVEKNKSLLQGKHGQTINGNIFKLFGIPQQNIVR